jgi:hypothetical protein
MAHFAQLDDDNTVLDVMKISDDYEDWGEDYINNVCMIPGRWIKTSYNTIHNKNLAGGTPFRGNYASIGGKYDPVRDVFVIKKPYPSWVLNETTYTWEAPVPFPDLIVIPEEMVYTGVPGKVLVKQHAYIWNENIVNWELRYLEKIIDVPLD